MFGKRSTSGSAVAVTDRVTGKEIWRQDAAAPVVFLAFAPGGKAVVSRDENGQTCTWDALTGKELRD